MTTSDLLRKYFEGSTSSHLFMGDPSDPSTILTVATRATDQKIQDHLDGKIRIGFSPFIDQSGRSKFCAIDIDTGDPEHLAAACHVLEEAGVTHCVERSKSRGWHIWIFCQRILAPKLRQLGSWVIEKAGLSGIVTEVFPKQDRPEGTGNSLFLPLFSLNDPEHVRSRFVDCNDDLLDQQAVLASLQRIDDSTLDRIIQEHGIPQLTPTLETVTTYFEDIPEELPTEFVELLDRDKELAAAWSGTRQPPNDPSRSGYDAMLAGMLVARDFKPNQIAGILPRYPHGRGENAKAAYLDLTISKARELVLGAPVDGDPDRRAGDDEVVGDGPPKGGNQQQRQLTRQSASDLRASYKPTEWIVDGIVPVGGIVLFASDPGVGKTWLGLDMALVVAGGGTWLDHFTCKPGKVLLVLEEEDPNSVIERLDKLYAARKVSADEGDSWPFEFLIQQNVNLDDVISYKHLEREVGLFQPALIIIDTLRRVHRADENSSGEMGAVFRRIRGLTSTTEPPCSVVLMHHNRKPSPFATGSLGRIRGSTDITGASDGVLEISGKFPELKIEHAKNKRGPEIDPFKVIVEGLPEMVKLEYENKMIKGEKDSLEGRKVVEKVLENGPMNQKNFREACSKRDWGRDRIEKICDHMRRENLLAIEVGVGKSKMYRLVGDGTGNRQQHKRTRQCAKGGEAIACSKLSPR